MSDICSTSAEPRYRYQLFGMTVGSPLPLPLAPAVAADTEIDIGYGSVPHDLEDATHRGMRFSTRPGELLFSVDGIASYWIRAGQRIVIARDGGASDDDVRVFLLGSALGALLHQRGSLVLHGSAVVVNDMAIAFLGASGVGKSTLAMAFAQRGLPVLSDDLCVLAPSANGELQVQAGCQYAKLWVDSLQHLDIAPSPLAAVRKAVEKRMLPLAAAATTRPATLRHAYILQTTNRDVFEVEHIQGAQKFWALRNQTYRLEFAKGLGVQPVHFDRTLQLAQQCSLATIRRPRRGFRLEELVDCIAADCGA